MAKLSRWKQLIFGKTGNTSEFGKIGSDTIGSPENTKDPAAIQSLAGYLSGLFAITNSGVEAPRLEDLNSLFFIITSQLAYLMEAGVPEWLATQEYWIGSRARIGQKVYMSLTGEGEAPNVGNNPASDAINWRDLDAYYRNAANLLGTLPLARLPTVLTGKKASTAEVADAAVKLLTAITIGGVSFDGSAPINLPGVNIAGNQNTTGNAATATNATNANYAATAGSAPANGGTSAACSGNAATATYATSAGSAGSATNATNATNVDLAERPTSGSAFLPVFTTDANGNQQLKRGPRVYSNAKENDWFWYGRSSNTDNASRVNFVDAPASKSASGVAGQFAVTTGGGAGSYYLYVCVANNTWRRTTIGEW